MFQAKDTRALLLVLLVATLLTNVTKAVFGPQANAVVDLWFLAVMGLLLLKGTVRYSGVVMAFVAYVVAHAAAQYLTHGGLFSGNNYTDYRNFVRGGAVVLLLLNTRFSSVREVHKFFAVALAAIAGIAFIDIFFESLGYHVLGIDLRGLPWVQAAYGSLGVDPPYGDPASRSRIPTLLGAPHHLALVYASLVFVFWQLHRLGHLPRWWFLLALAAVLLIQSRLQILVVFGVVALHQLRHFRMTPGRLAAVGVSAVALVFVIRTFGGAFVLTYHPDFVLAQEVYRLYGSTDVFRELIVTPPWGEMHKIVFGVGGVTGTAQYDNILSLAQVEIGLITDMIPKYGLVFVALYYAMLLQSFFALRRAGHPLLGFALVPFMVAPAHMWLVNITFVSDMFFAILAYCLLVARAAGVEASQVSYRPLVAAPAP